MTRKKNCQVGEWSSQKSVTVDEMMVDYGFTYSLPLDVDIFVVVVGSWKLALLLTTFFLLPLLLLVQMHFISCKHGSVLRRWMCCLLLVSNAYAYAK